MTVIVPADSVETDQAVRAVARLVGPVFLRISRMGVPLVHRENYTFQIRKADRLRDD